LSPILVGFESLSNSILILLVFRSYGGGWWWLGELGNGRNLIVGSWTTRRSRITLLAEIGSLRFYQQKSITNRWVRRNPKYQGANTSAMWLYQGCWYGITGILIFCGSQMRSSPQPRSTGSPIIGAWRCMISLFSLSLSAELILISLSRRREPGALETEADHHPLLRITNRAYYYYYPQPWNASRAAKMFIAALPVELISKICNHLDFQQLVALRLSCRALYKSSLENFAKTFYRKTRFIVTSESLHGLEELSKSNGLREYVQELWMIPTVFDGTKEPLGIVSILS
jgi:hypothetical protein